MNYVVTDEQVMTPIKRCSCSRSVWYSIPSDAKWMIHGECTDGAYWDCATCFSTMFIALENIPAEQRNIGILQSLVDPSALRLASPHDRNMLRMIDQTLLELGASVELRYPEEDEHATHTGAGGAA